MKAKDLMSHVPSVRMEDPADALLHAFDDPAVRLVAVITSVGELVGAIGDENLLDALLPAYLLAGGTLAAVLDEATADTLRERIAGKRVRDLFEACNPRHPVVKADDTLLEVAAALARARERSALVVEEGRLLGAITVDRLVHTLMHPTAR